MALALIFAMEKLALAAVAALLAFWAGPAFAQGGTEVSEPSTALLLALGLLGIIIGRRGAMRPKDHPRDDDPK